MKLNMEVRLDITDRKLLTILSNDNTPKYAALGEQLNLYAPAVFVRVKRLKKEGVITGSVFTLDGTKLGKPLLCFVQVTTNTIERTWQVAKLSSILDIQEIHSITGSSSVMLKIRTTNTTELEQILSQINQIEGVTGTNTQIVLSTLLERGVNAE
jgi:DNA-binding Lrp family transcriptional regulator